MTRRPKMAIDTNFPTFTAECKAILGTFLSHYGIDENGISVSDLAVQYGVNDWIVEVSMVANFPWIEASLGFLNVAGIEARTDLLDEALAIDRAVIQEISEQYFDIGYRQLPPPERHRIELKYLRALLERCYLPILEGKFSYQDFLKFQKTNLK